MLPYTTPPPSLPGTPLHHSRPGTPSKRNKAGPTAFLSALIQDPSNPAVREKHHLSTARSSSGGSASSSSHLPRPLQHLAPYFTTLAIPLPRSQKLLLLPVPAILVTNRPASSSSRRPVVSGTAQRKRPSILGFVVILILCVVAVTKVKHRSPRIKIPFVDQSTNVLSEEQIHRLWKWEIGRGHYPSTRRTPTSLNLAGVLNPGVDADTWDYHPETGSEKAATLPRGPKRFPAEFPAVEAVQPSGPGREYLNISSPNAQNADLQHPSSLALAYPPRPTPFTTLDLDIVMDHCDFTTNQYVRDCLEMLRTASGLDNGKRLRRGRMDHWRHIYSEKIDRSAANTDVRISPDGQDMMESLGYVQKNPQGLDAASARSAQKALAKVGAMPAQVQKNLQSPNLKERRSIVGFGASAKPHPTHPTADPMCDPDYPRIFHIFWAGPFTDKPYLAASSFLYTQNLALHLDPESEEMQTFLQKNCRPQLWFWINPGPAASVPNPHARKQMFDQLRNNPWSAPFLHDRFSDAIKFKMWNTTEQLDNIPELRQHWRSLPLFNSGGVKYGTPTQDSNEEEDEDSQSEEELLSKRTESSGVVLEETEEKFGRFGSDATADIDEALKVKGAGLNATAAPEVSSKRHPQITSAPKPKQNEDDLLNRVGSTSSKGYDRLTVVLSDMARFVLTHRFGGVYLDADTIFLRDWEELWGWKGAFAYRWSRLEKYNTAVLKMHRNSAIGSFLFKSALANGLDFHPMTISKYTRDANVEGLLLRLPDALFDSAWLNTEYYQRDRPAYPYFKRFEDFFDPPKEDSAAPLVQGFEGFFRGAFSYHFHNFWWIPFDAARNWPDLGPRFAAGERVARARALAEKLAAGPSDTAADGAQGRSPTRPPQEGGPNVPLAGPTSAKPQGRANQPTNAYLDPENIRIDDDDERDDVRELSWATVLKRTFEAYIREERPNAYGEWLRY